MIRILTTDGVGLVVDGCDLRIKLNIHIALVSHLDVPGIDLSHYPLVKRLTDNSVDYVGDVLPGHLVDLLLGIWKGIPDLPVILGEFQEVLDGQVVVLGHRDVLDVFALDLGLTTTSQVTHVIDSHIIVWRQVGATFVGQEVVHFPLSLELGTKVLGYHRGPGLLLWDYLVRHLGIWSKLCRDLKLLISNRFRNLNPRQTRIPGGID